MTLASHAVVGATVASFFPTHPILAFILAFFSHFVLDVIPHWDYKILSSYANPLSEHGELEEYSGFKDKLFILDLTRTGADTFIGFFIVAILFYIGIFSNPLIILIGAVAGILPDFLQFTYARFPHQPLIALQNFHTFIHSEIRLSNDKPFIGILTQVLIVSLIVLIVYKLILI